MARTRDTGGNAINWAVEAQGNVDRAFQRWRIYQQNMIPQNTMQIQISLELHPGDCVTLRFVGCGPDSSLPRAVIDPSAYR
jgi:hypothetical protein